MCQKTAIFQKKLGLRINELRIKKEMSFQELAYRSDIEKSNLIRVIQDSQNPTIRTLFKISDGLNVKFNDLFNFCDKCEICYLAKNIKKNVT